MSTLPNNTEPQNVVSKKGKDSKNDDDRLVSNSQEVVPKECSPEEFNELLTQASSLTLDEAKSELLDCARYGEVDAVRAILDTFQSSNSSSLDGFAFIDVTDKSGSTALHKSCANGHVSTTKLLLHRGASHLSNLSGNTPLHWAAASGHENIVRLLLTEKRFGMEEMDVLRKNEFGRSALTEGFASQNTVLVGLLLEHDSAEEERLLGGAGTGAGTTTSGGGDDDGDESKSIGEEGKDSDGRGHEPERNAAAAADGDCGSSVNTADTPKSSGSSSAKTCVVHEFDFQTVLNEQTTDEGTESFTSDGEEQPSSVPPVTTTDEVDDDAAMMESDQKEERRRMTKTTLLIRELPIANADNPFGESAVDDTTGLGIWCASLVMARWMASTDIVNRLHDKSVLELGAGCGVPGLTAALYSNAKSVYVTDLNPSTVHNLRYNIDLNRKRSTQSSSSNAIAVNKNWDESRVSAQTIDWDDETTWPLQQQQQHNDNDGEEEEGLFDFVIGSDLIYQSSIVPLLKKVVSGLLKKDGSGTFLYVAPDDGREGLPEFIESMKKEKEGGEEDDGFELVDARVAPDSFRTNPLSSGDADDCFLHFHELASTTYVLYEFRRRRALVT